MNWGIFLGLICFGIGLSSMLAGVMIESAGSFFIGLLVFVCGCLFVADEFGKGVTVERVVK